MSERTIKNRTRLRTFSVGYYLEQGFAISVEARSRADAERIIRERLDDESGELAGSERVHYDDGVTDSREVQP